MNLEEYQNLRSNDSVLKLYDQGGINFITENEKFIVTFFFMHRGYSRRVSLISDERNRIYLKTFPHKRLKVDIPLTKIRTGALIMVNSDIARFAMTFLLEVNEDDGYIKVKLQDRPNAGEGLITNEEIEGIELKL